MTRTHTKNKTPPILPLSGEAADPPPYQGELKGFSCKKVNNEVSYFSYRKALTEKARKNRKEPTEA